MAGSKKVLILSDSLPLPRLKPEKVEYEETWPCLLRERFPSYLFHQVSIGGATLNDLYRQLDYHQYFRPDVVILQSGIVDCAPRALTKFEIELLNKFYLTRRLSKYIVSKYSAQIRKFRKITYTHHKLYEITLIKIKDLFSKQAVLAIGITPSSKEYEASVPGISSNIEVFNQILQSTFKEGFLSLDSLPSDAVMSDFHHINNIGHCYIFQEILKRELL